MPANNLASPTRPPRTRYRIRLPADARRPHQVLTDLAAAPHLTFSAAFSLGVPATTRSETVPRRSVDALLQAGGGALRTVVHQLLRREEVVVQSGQDPLDFLPGSVYPELLEHAERLTAAPAKWLELSPRDVVDLKALGFQIEPEAPASDPEPDPQTQEA